MILTLDIGNTNITIGVYDKSALLFVSRMATDRARMGDQYAIELRDILDIYGVHVDEIEGAIISSVVPPLTPRICHAITQLTGVKPLCVGEDTKTGLKLCVVNPESMGADLVVGCVAALKMFGSPCIVLDLGTATTMVVLDKNRKALGGCIIPGVGISMDALSMCAAQLPSVSLEAAPAQVICNNTVDSMRCGAIYGTACMLDGMIERMEQELGEPCKIIATGGLAKMIVPQCRREIIYCENLLLDGLRIIYEDNLPAESIRG